MSSSSSREGRGRVEDDPPKKPKLVFGLSILCPSCKGKGVKKGQPCRGCHGIGIVLDDA